MAIKVKNQENDYKYPLNYNNFMLRGSSLKSTHWVYGVVVYTGRETKIKQKEAKLGPVCPKVYKLNAIIDIPLKWLFFFHIILSLLVYKAS